jgi:hypothetical protein
MHRYGRIDVLRQRNMVEAIWIYRVDFAADLANGRDRGRSGRSANDAQGYT